MKNIKLENEITVNTLKKVYFTQEWWRPRLDNSSDMEQFLENLDNWYITDTALKIIVHEIFNENKNGGFRKTLDVFGSRNKKRFIKNKLAELLGE